MQITTPSQPTTVVILGAGMAGLVSAYELMRAGFNVKVLEAKHVAGGRVQTLRQFEAGLHAEAGAMFLDGPSDLTIQYAEKLNVPLLPFPLATPAYLYYVKGKQIRQPGDVQWPYPLTPAEQKLGLSGMSKKYGAVPAALPGTVKLPRYLPEDIARLDAITVLERMSQLGASPGALEFFSIGFNALIGDGPDSYSALMMAFDAWFTVNQPTGQQAQGGNDQYPQAFANQLGSRVTYNAQITHIEQDAQQVKVTVSQNGSQQQVTGNYAICTLPFSVLRKIPVSPAFSQPKQEAIETLKYTSTVRVCLQFKEQFWAAEGLSGLAITDLPIGIAYPQPQQPSPTGILNIVMAGQDARDMAARSEAERLQFTLDQLSAFYPQAKSLYVDGCSKDWDGDPFACGAYPYFQPFQLTGLGPAIERPEGRIYFAGDHVSTLPGWIEGALESGLKAAHAIGRQAGSTYQSAAGVGTT